MAAINVKITDKGLKASVRAIFGARNSSVKVGVFGDKGDAPVETREGPPSTLSVADLAAIHEFGLGNVPERSFIRSYFDGNMERIQRTLLNLMSTEIQRAIRTGKPIEDSARARILNRVGLMMQGEIQQRIAKGEIEPPLAAKTVERKGSSIPLIDTGQLRSSISYEVDLNGTGGSDNG